MNHSLFTKTVALFSLTMLLAFTPPGKITVYLIGDSTMSIKPIKTYPIVKPETK